MPCDHSRTVVIEDGFRRCLSCHEEIPDGSCAQYGGHTRSGIKGRSWDGSREMERCARCHNFVFVSSFQ